MKLDSNIYAEAQRAARFPRIRLLMLGAICGAIVPTMYMRNYFLPRFRKETLQDINGIGEQVKSSETRPNGMTRPVMKVWPVLNSQQRNDSMMVPITSWRRNDVNMPSIASKYARDDDSTMLMFSSIM